MSISGNISKRFLVIFIAAVSVTLSARHITAEMIDRVVASVGDEIITLSDLMEASQHQPDIELDRLLEDLIDEKLIEIQARKQGVEVAEGEIDVALQRYIAQAGIDEKEFEKVLAKEGLTMEQYRDKIRAELMKVKFVQNNIQGEVEVTEDEVLNYYRRHPEQFRSAEKIRIAHIYLPHPLEADEAEKERVRQLAEEIRAAATNGEEFSTLAKKHSKSSTAPAGGDLGWLDPKDLIPSFSQAVSRMKVGSVSETFEMGGGVHVLFLHERNPGGVLPFDTVKEQIRQYLYSKKIADELDRLLYELKQEISVERML